ncbi:FkbM family methyltransferase [Streptomyces sp. NPDC051018]|uniref:FkbM family methyltransferase n=1 Tax=Streptomyces sp. NPDC051018 TaxID=3365639 RepID=UPI0037BB2B6A
MALTLLCAGALLMAVSLLLRPPTTAVAAGDRLALGLLLALSLAPASRYGYLLYPLVPYVWFRSFRFSFRFRAFRFRLPPLPGDPMSARTARPRPHPDQPVHTTRPAPATHPVRTTRAAWAHALTRRLGRRLPFVEAEIDGLDKVVRPGDVCLDVGSEYGLYTYSLAALTGPYGTVHSFEPLPGPSRVVAVGSLLLSSGNVRHHQLALGREPGPGTMSLPLRRRLPVHGRAFLTTGAEGLGPNEEFAAARPVPVDVATIDGRAAAGCFDRVDFIKADVEGAEPAVLAGAEEVLKRDRPTLLLEIEARHLAKYGDTPDGLAGWLTGLGYTMYIWQRGDWRPADTVTGDRRNYLFTVRNPGV